ncbi:hypothetical protein [Halomarina rubra]|uniref:Uncharacterized protein n=1 Tax=Halomarina rubra TaxID=2071873 RepID=A0ABD6AYT6_9EURY|nr:hypothetical protein [Halomarina rubra]
MSWLARVSVERPYVLGWVLFVCWLNGWLVTGLVHLAKPHFPLVLVGMGIPRTLYANTASAVALVVFVLAVYAQVWLLRRALPRLDFGNDTPRTRRYTAFAALALVVAVPFVTDATGIDPYTVVVLGFPPVLLLVEFLVMGVVRATGGEPRANAS